MMKHVSTRRLFLQRGMALVAVTPTIPTFLDQTVMAMLGDGNRVQQPNGKDGKILVVVQMSGGNDGLNTVVPHGDDHYYRARGALAHDKKAVNKINDYVGLAPNLTAFKEMYDQGRLTVVQGVGYPNPNRSHFRSMDIWHSAYPDKELATSGWLGRYFDNTCTGEDPHVGINLGGQIPLSMKGERMMPLSFERPESYRYVGKDFEHYKELNSKDGMEGAAAAGPATQPAPKKLVVPAKKKIEPVTAQSQLDFLHRTAMDAQVSSDDILRLTKTYQPTGTYPGSEFGNGMRTIAAMIAGGLQTRVYYISLGGFDTHANQAPRHAQLMKELSDGIQAFWADMKQQKNDERVLMMSFSEFGRRVEVNASNGTDHGAAASMFLMGPKVNAGLAGKYPSLTDLDQGDLKFNTDFRNVYAGILQNWLDTPSKPILGQQFDPMKLTKA
jgi:uncharacterized protein (DUF1501 family)